MSGSYKITLVFAAALFVFIVGYWYTRDGGVTAPPSEPTVEATEAPQEQPPDKVADTESIPTPPPPPVVAATQPADAVAQTQPVQDEAPPPPPPPPPAPTTYVVQGGDDFPAIAKQLYGDEKYWSAIAVANPSIDPIDPLPASMQIRLPSDTQLREAELSDLPVPGKVVSYTTRSGDNLWNIAQEHYGDGSKWRYIFNANRTKLGNNPDAIPAGVTIRIPPLAVPTK